jgi:hypothetical protein
MCSYNMRIIGSDIAFVLFFWFLFFLNIRQTWRHSSQGQKQIVCISKISMARL